MKRITTVFLILFLTFSAFGRSLDEIKRSGVIYVAFTESSYNSVNRIIAEEFAKFLNVKMEVVKTSWQDNFSKNGVVPKDLETNPNLSYTPDALKKADFICGTIYVYPWRKKLFDYAGIMYVSDLLVVRSSQNWNYLIRMAIPEELLPDDSRRLNVKTYSDLKGLKIALLGNSSYQKNLTEINKKIGGGIELVLTKSEEESQRLMQQGKVDGFVAVSYIALKYLKDNPDSRLAFPVGKPFEVGWAVEKGNNDLKREIDNFYETIKGNGRLDEIFLKYYKIDYKTYLDIINSYAEAKSNGNGRDLDEILASGKLIVALRDRDLIYHPTGKKQLSQHLAEEFARYLGVDLQIVVAPDLATYFEDSNGQIVKDSSYTPEFMKNVDIVCDLLEPVPWRLSKVDIIGYAPLSKVVVARKGTKITTVADLKKLRGVTSKGSSYEQALIDNGITNYYYAPTTNLLDEVEAGNADYTLWSFIFTLPDYPSLEAKFIMGDIKKVGWAIKKNQPKLRQKILEFFEYAEKSGMLDNYFKMQTGMPFKALEKYLIALQQTYNIGVFPFVFYGTDQGLPQEDVEEIFQDNKGYIWFATLGGAVRFNGRTMKIYTTDSGLLSNEVFDIDEDLSDSTIYFATLRGVSALHNDQFDTLWTERPFRQIFIDKYNNKWFYGDYGAVVLTRKGTEVDLNYKFPKFPQNINSVSLLDFLGIYLVGGNQGLYIVDTNFNEAKKVSNKMILDVFVDEEENVWLATDDGLYYTENAFRLPDGDIGRKINKEIKIGDQIISRIVQTKNGAIWLISNFKAYQLFSLRQSPIVYDQQIGLSGQKIHTFFTDNEENYWFGQAGGIQKLTNKSLRIIYPSKLKYYVHSLLLDKENHLWYAFTNSLYVLGDSLLDLSSHLNTEPKSYAVAEMNNHDILVASTAGIYIIDPVTLKVIRKHTFAKELPQIQKVFVSKNNEIFILTGSSGFIYYFKNFDAQPVKLQNSNTTFVYQLVEYDGLVIGGNSDGLIYFNGDKFKTLKKLNHTVWTLKVIDDSLYIGTEKGLGIYSQGNFTLLDLDLPDNSVTAIAKAHEPNHLWVGTNKGFCYVNLKNNSVEFSVDANDGLPGNEVAFDGLTVDPKGMLWIGTLHGIATYDIKKKSLQKYSPNCQIETILLNGEEVRELPAKLKFNQNNITFELTGLSFRNEESLVYDYYLRGLKGNYQGWKGNSYKATFQNLPPGKYQFNYRAKGKDGIWSYYKSIGFEIEKPLWLRTWFIVLAILFVMAGVYFVMKLREKALKRRNEILERLVTERTHEIEMQKVELEQKNLELEQQQEEIIAQRDELARQRDIARKQRDEIAKQQEAIMDSIYYAKKIQSAILPPLSIVKNYIPEFFVLYLPRDIVSGDFYWFKNLGDKIIVTAADCTGHGVPGAFMSMLGVALLEEIVYVYRDKLTSGLILTQLRNRVVESLHQTGKIEEAKDGMDIALYILDTKTLRVQFSGAFNPMIVVRQDTLYEIKGDRMPIGIFEQMREEFKTNYFDVETGDLIYTFSDGYASQFGSKKGKKFKISRLKKLFMAIQHLPMEEQREMLYSALKNWMGIKYEQVDDILVIGVKVTWERVVEPEPIPEEELKKNLSITVYEQIPQDIKSKLKDSEKKEE